MSIYVVKGMTRHRWSPVILQELRVVVTGILNGTSTETGSNLYSTMLARLRHLNLSEVHRPLGTLILEHNKDPDLRSEEVCESS